ncbi:hypothetical protein SARC_05243 [Sphaeroforma arctica JP610]|uniref:Saposin A-type domain-containing protein n=1 Tax=Sphaeroforma arctica JP610 TaxID=667725 RepID=A0A0L0G2P5_9EUKA|nr:hypothetical protein SARC_05243 [Sphaeroforma arctica JP610]KNC82473.1 hypothetical protein SARC_05243 [Sphaeroforma arctica JP610]|eukprot:XP_014156375.1 hypothetical protein SARC_05243 [Sphaeroforma arctica JP610]
MNSKIVYIVSAVSIMTTALAASLPGSNVCTQGPSYWCASEANAAECNFEDPGVNCLKYCEDTDNSPYCTDDMLEPQPEESPLIGADPCTWGPSYWCSSEENASECGFNNPESECQKYCADLDDSPFCPPMDGSDPCTWGPSYWCASADNAEECKLENPETECQKYCDDLGPSYWCTSDAKAEECQLENLDIECQKYCDDLGPSYWCASEANAEQCQFENPDIECQKHCGDLEDSPFCDAPLEAMFNSNHKLSRESGCMKQDTSLQLQTMLYLNQNFTKCLSLGKRLGYTQISLTLQHRVMAGIASSATGRQKQRVGWQKIDLSSQEYWNNYYDTSKEDNIDSTTRSDSDPVVSSRTTEWFCTSEEVARAVVPRVRSIVEDCEGEANILELGCGVSNLSILVQKEFPLARMIAVDSSQIAINTMQERVRLTADKSPTFKVADILNMQGTIADNSVDVLLDKGTMDALVHGDRFHKEEQIDSLHNTGEHMKDGDTSSHTQSQIQTQTQTQTRTLATHSHAPIEAQARTHSALETHTHTHTSLGPRGAATLCGQLVSEIVRVLCAGGVYVQISDEAPEMRCDFLTDHFSQFWDRRGVLVNFSELELEGGFTRYLYTVKLYEDR